MSLNHCTILLASVAEIFFGKHSSQKEVEIRKEVSLHFISVGVTSSGTSNINFNSSHKNNDSGNDKCNGIYRRNCTSNVQRNGNGKCTGSDKHITATFSRFD